MKNIIVYGGGTFSHVRAHLALAAPAFGSTAKLLATDLTVQTENQYNVLLRLTKMADPVYGRMVTNDDVASQLDIDITDPATRAIIFNVALCDYNGEIEGITGGKYAERLKTSQGIRQMTLSPADKLLKKIRSTRKDIFLVAFKTTAGLSEKEQYIAGLNLLKENSCNLVVANDLVTRNNILIVPEEAYYTAEDYQVYAGPVPTNRSAVLYLLVNAMLDRMLCTFTRSTVVPQADKGLPWVDGRIPAGLKKVVDHCISKGAYKPFRGATAGHFAYKISDTTFATSKRKTDFNRLHEDGLVYVESTGSNSVVAYGAKPSVGGQSQRIIFAENPDIKYIVHFHSPPKDGVEVPKAPFPQLNFECGSHQCGQNTSLGLAEVGRNIKAVYLSNHGPNIVFGDEADPDEVIRYIDSHFDLSAKTGGLVA